MTRRRRLLGGALAVVVLSASLVLLVLATESGTRWLWARGESFAPEQLTVGDVGGTLLSTVTIERIRWRDDAVSLAVERAEAELSLGAILSGTLRISRLGISDVDIDARAGAEESPSAEPPTARLPFDLQIDDAEITAITFGRPDAAPLNIASVGLRAIWADSSLALEELRVVSDLVELSAGGEFLLEPPYAISASAGWRARVEEWRDPGGELTIQGTSDEYVVNHRLTAPVVIESELRLADALGAWRAAVDSRWEEISLAVDDEAVVRSSGGELSIQADESTYGVSGVFDVGSNDLETVAVSVAANGNRDFITVERFSAQLPVGDLEATGRIDPNELSWAMDIAIASGALEAISPALQGPFDVTALIEGRVHDRETASVEIFARDIAGQIERLPLSGTASVAIEAGSLSRVGADVAFGDSSATMDLIVDANVDGELNFTIDDLSMIGGVQRGRVVGSAALSGPRQNPSLTFSASGQDVTLGSLTADLIETNLSGTMSEHSITLRAARLGDSLEATAAGGVGNETWRGKIRSVSLEGADGGRWSAVRPAAILFAANTLTVDEFCLRSSASEATLCAEIARDTDSSIRALLNGRDLPLDALSVALPERLEPSGSLSVDGDVRITDGNVDGDVSVSIRDGLLSTNYGGEVVSAAFSGSATGEIVDSRLTSSLDVGLDGLGRLYGGMEMSDVLEADAPLSGTLEVTLDDLSFVEVVVPEVQSPEGRVSGELSLSGTRAEPRLLGEIRLVNGRFGVAPAGIELDAVELHARQLSGGAFGLSGSARSGDGRVEFEGGLLPDEDASGDAWIEIRGSDVELLRLTEQTVIASPNLNIVFAPNQAAISGTVAVPTADITVDALPEGAARPSPDVVVHRADGTSGATREITLDVAVSLGDEVRVAGYGLSTRVHGNLNVTGSSRRTYIGTGRLDLKDGEYEAFGQTLSIERGELFFNGPLAAPRLNIRAIRDAGDVTAGVHLTGTPNDLRSTVFSDPAMRDADALSYLLTGRPLSGASSSEGDTLNQAAFALGLSRAGAVTEQIRGTLGLETLAVEGGGDSSRVVAGKRLGGRLFVEYGYGLIDQLGTLLLRFQINDRLVVETTSGSATTLDLVYSVKKD